MVHNVYVMIKVLLTMVMIPSTRIPTLLVNVYSVYQQIIRRWSKVHVYVMQVLNSSLTRTLALVFSVLAQILKAGIQVRTFVNVILLKATLTPTMIPKIPRW